MIIKKLLKKEGKTIAQFGRDIGTNRVSALRIANGKRFKNIRSLFLKIYKATNYTPNQILEIPPKENEMIEK